ncbi:MAG: hypothetical protein JXN64_04775, partial [Spirochaetes bacterium]|nr:hypothetical protein [Spirochaetota bacterium]
MIIKKFIIIFAILMSPMIQLNAFEVGEVSEKEEQKDAAEANISGEAIVVTGTKTEKRLKETPVRTEVISGERIENSGAKNLFEIFDKGLLPGVTVNTS